MLDNISIIIPLGPGEDQHHGLLDDLRALCAAGPEIIPVACDGSSGRGAISSLPGRALQQNCGAAVARRDFLWFLHADSTVTDEVVRALAASVKEAPDSLHYFHLKFAGDGAGWLRLNEWGARFRSDILGLPFGDQGFCLSRENFNRIGGFPEQAAYGEDHLLVWHARQAGIALRPTGVALTTSARKYRTHGWGRLTVKYQLLWIRQAWPEFLRLFRRLFWRLIGRSKRP